VAPHDGVRSTLSCGSGQTKDFSGRIGSQSLSQKYVSKPIINRVEMRSETEELSVTPTHAAPRRRPPAPFDRSMLRTEIAAGCRPGEGFNMSGEPTKPSLPGRILFSRKGSYWNKHRQWRAWLDRLCVSMTKRHCLRGVAILVSSVIC
jgi:hypothetical protein